MHLQNAAVGKTASNRFFDFCHVSTTALGKQQRLSHGTNRDAHNHLIRQLGKLATAVRTHMRGAAKVCKHRLCAFKICLFTAHHDDQFAVNCT